MSVTEKNITINPIVNGVKDTNTNLYPKTKVENLVDFPSPANNFNKFLHTNAIDGSIEWATVGVPTGAFSFIGTTTTALTDGSTTNPITIGGESVTATNGNVVIYGNKEFAWTGSYWEELGDEGVASSTALGNVKLGSDTTIDSTAAKTYPIQLNSNNQMYVNVPWTDNNTTYSLATTSSSGLLRALESSSVSSQTQSTKFLREDGTWAAPSYTTNTNYYQTPDYSAGLKIATGTGVNDLYVPYATTSSAGSVSVGSGLSVSSGALSVDTSVIATKSDLPSGEVDVNFNDTTSTVTTTTALSNITLVGDTRYTITSTRETAASGGTTLSLVNTNDMYVWNNKQDSNTVLTSVASQSSGTGLLKLTNGAASLDTNSYLTSHLYRPIKVDGVQKLADNVNTALDLVAGTNITLSESDGAVIINASGGSSYDLATTQDINRLFETEYTITTSVTNGTYTGDASIWTSETATVTVSADTDYELPATITVTGASYTYNQATGVIVLSNVTDNVSIGVVCESTVVGYQVDVRWNSNEAYTCSTDGQYYTGEIYDGQSNQDTLIGYAHSDVPTSFIYDSNHQLVTGPFTITSGYITLYLSITYADSSAFGSSGTEPWVVRANPADSFDLTGNSSGSHHAGFTLTIPVSGNGTLYLTDGVICLVEGTQITLADGSKKAIEEVNYNDELLVYDFFNDEQTIAKPSWIAEPLNATFYYETVLENGIVLRNAGPHGHRMFNYTKQSFMYPEDFEENDSVLLEDGTLSKIVSNKIVKDNVKVYNVITDTHYNLYAENILTSCRLSNMYEINNMKYNTNNKLMSDEAIEEYMTHLEATRKVEEN